jgi:hypothetical protein
LDRLAIGYVDGWDDHGRTTIPASRNAAFSSPTVVSPS